MGSNLDKLTQYQKIALEGDLVSALMTVKHDAELIYRLYTIIKSPSTVADSTTHLNKYMREFIEEKTSLSDRVIDKLFAEFSNNSYPAWIWADRIAADIKLSLLFASSDTMVTLPVSLNKKELQKTIIRSAFVRYVRDVAHTHIPSALYLCEKIRENNDLSFLHDICYTTIADFEDVNIDSLLDVSVPETVFHSNFDIRKLLNFRAETIILEKLDEKEKLSKKERKNKEKCDAFYWSRDNIESRMDEVIANASPQLKKTDAEPEEKYEVIKVFKKLGVSTPLKTFDSKEEAEFYVATILNHFPDIQSTVDFLIKKR